MEQPHVTPAKKEEETDRSAGAALGGAILGASLGGPPGAIIGGLIGLILAEQVKKERRRQNITTQTEQDDG